MGFNKVQFVALKDCLNITCLVAIQIQNEILLSNWVINISEGGLGLKFLNT
jgi:hypothetical protein